MTSSIKMSLSKKISCLTLGVCLLGGVLVVALDTEEAKAPEVNAAPPASLPPAVAMPREAVPTRPVKGDLQRLVNHIQKKPVEATTQQREE